MRCICRRRGDKIENCQNWCFRERTMSACRSGKSRARTSPVRAAASREPPIRVSLNERGRLLASARPTPEYVRSRFPKECRRDRRNWTFQIAEWWRFPPET